MQIRKAELSDFDALLEQYRELYALLGRMGLPFDLDIEGLKSGLNVMLQSNMFFLAVAEEQGSLCGFAAAGISRMDRKLSYEGGKTLGIIHDICVQPSCRGRGVADMLLSAAEAWLRECGVTIVECDILTENEPSLKFFAKHDYRDFCRIFYKTLEKE
jgi:ribosomal protein S18 acetylase RimI-like enzyme